ncbi:ATP11-domain-containing protein [Diplogelasinospora grovesii]|uniref:ATP11-domain-containing protein n=1 Tax=Diplogelasinospora grovesii TaxID=303347 RepID=A0AAN6NEK4_9PEZI|nr:ATP11-domain-containing protein [Diplogelasinospora grovesii]
MTLISRTSPALRHLCTRHARHTPPQLQQRRWAQVQDVLLQRFLTTTHSQRNVLDKYREKLDQKARDEGHADYEAMRKAYADRIAELRRQQLQNTPPAPPQPTPSSPTETQPTTTTQQQSTQFTKSSKEAKTGVKPLSSMLDLEKARTLPIAELTAIWRLRHASSPNSLVAVIPTHTYKVMEGLARKSPQFVLPVPHNGPEGGAELHFLQWTWDLATGSSTVLFTQLAEFKLRGEFAQPHTTITHYTDLAGAEGPGVVLMHGTVSDDRGVKADDARWLVMCLQKFYGGWETNMTERAEERKRLLEWFANGDERFSVERLLEEAERMG